MKLIWTLLRYIWWSNAYIAILLHPRTWRFDIAYTKPNEWDPKMHCLTIKLLMFKLYISIDDGSY